MISQHTDVEHKVLAELRQIELLASPLQPDPRSMSYDDIAQLTYTQHAIKVNLPPPACCSESNDARLEDGLCVHM